VITRLLAIIPAVITIALAGDKATYQLLILSQVILSLQLPFAVVPLVRFTSDKRRMGEFANPGWVKALAWSCAVLIIGLNVRLVIQQVSGWGASSPWLMALAGGIGLALLGLLIWMAFERRGERPAPGGLVTTASELIPSPQYRRILVPLDHSSGDRAAVSHAAAMARAHGAEVFLFHVEEGVTSLVYGAESQTAEVEEGRSYFESLARILSDSGVETHVEIRPGHEPSHEILAYARERKPDLVVMAAHGHRGLKDIAFGATIDTVRHGLPVPVLIVHP
jgi:manganese transport protein